MHLFYDGVPKQIIPPALITPCPLIQFHVHALRYDVHAQLLFQFEISLTSLYVHRQI